MNVQPAHSRRRGLTFLEVLIGLTLFALLMIAGTLMLHSMVKAHSVVETRSLFTGHVDGVLNFLQTLALESSRLGTEDPSALFAWERPPGFNQHTLVFRVDQEMPFFVSDQRPLPPLTAYLQFDLDKNQLWLTWSLDRRFTGNRQQWVHTLLSPWLDDVIFGYFDSSERSYETVRASTGGESRGAQRPHVIGLVFERAGQYQQRNIWLNPPGTRVLLY